MADEEKSTDLIVPNTHDLVAVKIQNWKKRQEAEAEEEKQKALTKKQTALRAEQLARQQALERKNQDKIEEARNYFAKSFIALCKNHLGVKRADELNEMTDQQLQALDEILAKEMKKLAWLQTVGGLSSCLLPIIIFKMGVLLTGFVPLFITGLLTLFAALFALTANFSVFWARGKIDKYENWDDCKERKYLWVYRKFLKKALGENYFPIKELRHRFHYFS